MLPSQSAVDAVVAIAVVEPVLGCPAALADEEARTSAGYDRTLLADLADASHARRAFGESARMRACEESDREDARKHEPDRQCGPERGG